MDLMVKNGARRYRKADKDEILSAAAQFMTRDIIAEDVSSPAKLRELVVKYLGPRDSEVFCAFWLDSASRLLAFEELFHGSIDGAQVFPREVVKKALTRNAAAVVFAHQHPSRVAEASVLDVIITGRLRDALSLVEIRVIDHLVVGGERVFSFAGNGLL